MTSNRSGYQARCTGGESVNGHNNEAILAWVEGQGGAYVWEPETFAVTLLGIDISDADSTRLSGLVGVDQIAVDATRLSYGAIERLASIPGLESLVLGNSSLSGEQVEALESRGPKVQLIAY